MVEKSFKKLYAFTKLNRKQCPWASEQDIKKQVKTLKGELKELEQALKKNDSKNFQEEFGDVLWDLIFLGVIAEEKGEFNLTHAIIDVNRKISRRKPWLGKRQKMPTHAEAIRIWKEVKRKEKHA